MLITGVCRGPSDQGGRGRSARSDGAFWYQFYYEIFFFKKNALDESESGRERSAARSDGAFWYQLFYGIFFFKKKRVGREARADERDVRGLMELFRYHFFWRLLVSFFFVIMDVSAVREHKALTFWEFISFYLY